MKRLITLVCLLILTMPFGLKAQNQTEERWENYVKEFENGVKGYTVRMDLIEYAPIAGFPTLLKVTNNYTEKRNDGFPTEQAFDELSQVTLGLLLSLNGKISFVYAGSTTYDGASTEFIYIEETKDLVSLVEDFYSKNHPTVKHDVSVSQDIIWKSYKDDLFPNNQILHFINDKRVIQNLIDSGDDVTVPRAVDHWIFFKTKEDMNSFGDRIQEFKFFVKSIDNFDNAEWPIQLVIFREDAVDLENISEITSALRNLASENNGIYDGWGTNLVEN